MGDQQRPQGPPSSKGTSSPGISPGELQQLRSRVEKLEKFIQEQLSEKNQWCPMIRSWVGTRVEIELLTGLCVSGELVWVDRYTMCIKDKDTPAIVHKGAIAVIRQEGQAA